MSRIFNAGYLLTVVVLVIGPFSPQSPAVERLPEFPYLMDTDPQLPQAVREYYLPKSVDTLWRHALASNDEDLLRETATVLMRLGQVDPQALTIIRTMQNELLEAFRRAENHTVRHAIAASLTELGIRDAADDLYEYSQNGSRIAQLTIEPVLAEWGYEPIRNVWQERLRDPSAVPPRSLLLAIRGLAQVHSSDVVEDLKALATDRTRQAEQRVAAAEALGRLARSGLETVAADLAAGPPESTVVDRLAAVKMLGGHRGDEAESLLLTLALDTDAPVAAIALQQLVDINPGLIHPHVNLLLDNPDAAVRCLAARSLETGATTDTVRRLTPLLNDPHPDVRIPVRDLLRRLAEQESLTDVILDQTKQVLDGEDWRGLEQAMHLAVHLDHKPVAGRIVDLLNHDRAEVKVTAAWALRELAVDEHLPRILAFATEVTRERWRTQRLPGRKRFTETVDTYMSFLFETIGQSAYSPARSMLELYIAKNSQIGPNARATAIWALGFLYDDGPPPNIVQQLTERMMDDAAINPEFPQVRVMSTVCLGRLKAESAVPDIRLVVQTLPPYNRLRIACQWAILQAAGTPMETIPPFRIRLGGSFLRPIRLDHAFWIDEQLRKGEGPAEP